MRNGALLKKRNESLEQDFNRFSNKYKKKPEKVYQALREKYFITDRTIDAILRGEYDKPKKENTNQLKMF